MRAGIGLLSLLIVMCIIFYISFGMGGGGTQHSGYVGTVLDKGKEGREEAAQISGHTEDNVPIADTIKMDEISINGEFRKLKVLSITPNTPMDTAYGLKVGDEITAIGGLNVRDNNDAGLAKAMVCEAYQRNQPLDIERNGEKMTLTPNTPLTQHHPELFGKPSNGGVTIPSH